MGTVIEIFSVGILLAIIQIPFPIREKLTDKLTGSLRYQVLNLWGPLPACNHVTDILIFNFEFSSDFGLYDVSREEGDCHPFSLTVVDFRCSITLH